MDPSLSPLPPAHHLQCTPTAAVPNGLMNNIPQPQPFTSPSSSSSSSAIPPRLPTLYPRPPLPPSLPNIPSRRAPPPQSMIHPHQQLSHPHPHQYQYPTEYGMPSNAQLYPQTCVPSLIPPDIDPTHVDMRTFYPYQPNEVKHRKRTTRQQLRVLEDVYKSDTKPNANLRKKLAEELGMTPRGVQVWFQNRRAKTKTQNRKAEQQAAHAKDGDGEHEKDKKEEDEDKDEDEPTGESASEAIDLTEKEREEGKEVKSEQEHAELKIKRKASTGSDDLVPPPESPAVASSPAIALTVDEPIAVPHRHSTSSDAWQPDPHLDSRPDAFARSITSPVVPHVSSQGIDHYYLSPPPANLAVRRPSLPVLPHLPNSPNYRPIPGGRRKSVDASTRLVTYHPYAYLAQGVNANIYGPNDTPDLTALSPLATSASGRVRHGSMPQVLAHGQPSFLRSPQGRRAAPVARMSIPGGLARPSNQSQNQNQQPIVFHNPFASVSAGYEFPPPPPQQHQRQPHSPSTHSPPPPISQSFLSGSNSTSSSAGSSPGRVGLGMGVNMYVTSRTISEPIPGPLPEPSFSFGMPASDSLTPGSGSGSGSSNGSPSPTTSNATLTRTAVADMEDLDDDASAVSSTYDAYSRWGSMASLAGSETSWTSAGWSDGGSAAGSKDAVEAYNNADRRPSIASGYLPQLFGELDVNGAGGTTPQPTANGESPVQEHTSPEMQRRASIDGSGFAQNEFENQPFQFGYQSPHDQNAYAQDQGPYQSAKGPSPPLISPSSSLGYAMHAPTSENNAELPLLYQKLTVPPETSEHLSPSQTHQQQQFAMQNGTSYADSFAPASQQQQSAFDGQGMYSIQQQQQQQHFEYNFSFGGSQVFGSGAIELDHMCVPAPMTMETISEYGTFP